MKRHVLVLCLLGNPYQRSEGGFHKTVYEIIDYFKTKDIIITIITSNTTLSKDNIQQTYSNINFCELAIKPEWIENQDQLFINADYLVDRIQQIINKYNNKLSMIHSLQWINGYLAAKINLSKEFIHIHSIISSSFERQTSGFSIRSQYQRQCEDIAFNMADLLISITEAEKRQLVEYYNIPPSKILIIGRTADLYYRHFHDIHHSQISKMDKLKMNSDLTQNNMLGNQKAFIYVGRIIEYKGIREIVKAWHLLYLKYNDEMPPLWIIGGTETSICQFRNMLVKEISFLVECEKKHKIYWWGYMETYGIGTIFQKSHVLLMHSAFEPGGRVLLEAMSAGIPIISTPMGFAQTYINDWYNGFLVEYKDINCLAAYMDFFVINEYLSSMLGINAQHTYDHLTKEWQYYQKLDKLYHAEKIDHINSPYLELDMESLHPFLIDEFPYCDIKNDQADILYMFRNSPDTIEEIIKHNSYIWKISIKNNIFIAKQVYNQINMRQLWNPFDKQKVHTIWMQYFTASFSAKYPCIISPSIESEKIFTYLLPYHDVLSDEQVYKVYPSLLKQLANCEKGCYEDRFLLKEQIKYFNILNHSIQYKHKYYTINIYVYELQKALDVNNSLFQHNEVLILKKCFQKIHIYVSSRNRIEYGLNYGKTFLKHVIQYYTINLLLPSSDIFIGELGQDEGIMFAIYYLKYNTFLEKTYYPRNAVFIWALLYCIELFISSRILFAPSTISLSELEIICNAISIEK